MKVKSWRWPDLEMTPRIVSLRSETVRGNSGLVAEIHLAVVTGIQEYGAFVSSICFSEAIYRTVDLCSVLSCLIPGGGSITI